MSKANEYTFHIDVFTPETLPMARLAEYLAKLADLAGSQAATHFTKLTEGSANLHWQVDEPEQPKVERRLSLVGTADATKDIATAFKAIDEMLAEDNAVAELFGPTGAIVLPFPGRNRPKPLNFPAFSEAGSIEGEVVRIGGKDATAHVTLQDNQVVYSNISLSRELARELAGYLYGPKVRLFGNGRWERTPEGAWRLQSFVVDRHEVLDDTPLGDVIAQIQSIGSGLTEDPDIYDELFALRVGKGDVH